MFEGLRKKFSEVIKGFVKKEEEAAEQKVGEAKIQEPVAELKQKPEREPMQKPAREREKGYGEKEAVKAEEEPRQERGREKSWSSRRLNQSVCRGRSPSRRKRTR